MKKKNFVSMILGTVGGIIFAIGMCICLVPELAAFSIGVVAACIGAVILVAMLIVRRKMEGKPAIKLSGKAIGTTALGVVGILVLGLGMCMAMVWSMMLFGIIVGVAGILMLMCLVPLSKGLK